MNAVPTNPRATIVSAAALAVADDLTERFLNQPEPQPGPHMVKVFHNHGNPINKKYVTLACGHRFAAAARQQPRGGCTTCWRTYFLENPDIAHVVGLIQTNQQNSSWKAAMLASQGKEFVKQAKSFLQFQQAQNPQPESSEAPGQ